MYLLMFICTSECPDQITCNDYWEAQVVGAGGEFGGNVSDFKANSSFSTAGSSPAGHCCLGAMVSRVPAEGRKFAVTLCVFVYG